MAVEVLTEFIAESTVRTTAYVYDDADELVDPTTSIKVSIWDSDGAVKVDDVAMTKVSTGVYEHYYNTSSSSTRGDWRGQVVVIDGTGDEAKTSIGAFGFKVR